jgi:hypothetical protein
MRRINIIQYFGWVREMGKTKNVVLPTYILKMGNPLPILFNASAYICHTSIIGRQASGHGFLDLYTILSHPASVVMSMVTGQKDPHEMAELYFRAEAKKGTCYCISKLQIGPKVSMV